MSPYGLTKRIKLPRADGGLASVNNFGAFFPTWQDSLAEASFERLLGSGTCMPSVPPSPPYEALWMLIQDLQWSALLWH